MPLAGASTDPPPSIRKEHPVIVLTRALARTLRALLRTTMNSSEARQAWPVVLCLAGPDGLTVQTKLDDLHFQYHQVEEQPTSVIAFRGIALADFEGASDEPVQLEAATASRGRASWKDGGVPRRSEFEVVSPATLTWPAMPSKLVPMTAVLVPALEEACRTTARQGSRYALTKVLLRGKAGEVVATDGRQLLIQRGFKFPWSDDVIVSRVPALKQLPETTEFLTVGRTDDHVAVQIGCWTVLLAIEKSARFPDFKSVIPNAAASSRLNLHPTDVQALLKAVPKLPGQEDENAPVTLDFDAPPAVRARGGKDGPAVELVLQRSTTTGPHLLAVTDRRFLHRMLRLGLTEIAAVNADKPLVSRDATRTFVWMPLSAADAVRRGSDVVRVEPSSHELSRQTTPLPRREPMPANKPDDATNGQSSAPSTAPTLDELLKDVEAMRDLLQQAHTRLGRLYLGLKAHRKHGRAVQAAVASLRQLPHFAP